MSFDISAFNPESFLDANLTEPTEKRKPLPVGDYTAVVGTVTARTWQGRADASKCGIAWDIPLTIDVPAEVQAELGMDNSTLNFKDSIMIDLTENGTIDNGPGKNRRLRAYREATDMNKPGDVFSARKMEGKIVRVKIIHDMWEGQPIEKISGVVAL